MGSPETPNQGEQPKMKPEFAGPMHGMKEEIFELDFPAKKQKNNPEADTTEDALIIEEAKLRARGVQPDETPRPLVDDDPDEEHPEHYLH